MMISATLFVLLTSLLAFGLPAEECKTCCEKPFENAASCCKIPPLIDREVAKKCGAGKYFDKYLRDGNSKSTGTAAAAKGTAAKTSTARKAPPKGKGKRAANEKSIPCVWECIFKDMDFFDEHGQIDDDNVEDSFKVGLNKAWFEETINMTIEACGDIVETNFSPEGAQCDHKAMFFMNCVVRFALLNCPDESANKKDTKCKEKLSAVDKCNTGIVKDPVAASDLYPISEEDFKKWEEVYKKEQQKAGKGKQEGKVDKNKKTAAVNPKAKPDPKAAKPAAQKATTPAAKKSAQKAAKAGKVNKKSGAAKPAATAATKKPAGK